MMWNAGEWGGWGFFGLHWIFAIVFWALVAWGLVALVGYLSRRGGEGGPRRDPALDALRTRYAKGELSREEFLRMKDDLKD